MNKKTRHLVPIEESLKFHLDDCLRWMENWAEGIKRNEGYLKTDHSDYFIKDYQKKIRSAKYSMKIIEKELFFVLASCLYWNNIRDIYEP